MKKKKNAEEMNNTFIFNRVNVFDAELSTEELNEVKNYIESYYNKNLTEDDLKNFCHLILDINCKIFNVKPCPLEFQYLNDNTLGDFTRADEIVRINTTTIEEIMKNGQTGQEGLNIFDLVDTIGHELEHARQFLKVKEFDKLSAEEQRSISYAAKKTVEEYKKYYTLNEPSIEAIGRVLRPDLFLDDGMFSNRDFLKKFCEDLSFAHYYTLYSEKEARSAGARFEKSILTKLKLNFFDDQEFVDILNKERERCEFNIDRSNKIYSDKMEFINSNTGFYTVDIEKILKIANDYESLGKGNKEDDDLGKYYSNVMEHLIKGKNLEEKLMLLKGSIVNNYPLLGYTIIDSLEKGVDFKSNKDVISRFIFDCYAEEPKREIEKSVFDSFSEKGYCYGLDLNKVMNEQDIKNLVEEKLKQGCPNDAFVLVDINCKNMAFSFDDIKKYQGALEENSEELFKKHGFDDFNKKVEAMFFKGIFDKVPFEEKIEMLKNNFDEIRCKTALMDSIEKDEKSQKLKNKLQIKIAKMRNDKRAKKEGGVEKD